MGSNFVGPLLQIAIVTLQEFTEKYTVQDINVQ